ncbi:hypothetical protein GGR53DRAFT_464710 [Hypoxylon sp. FL1150]|nr:hypothetical protein GGR53DRAFT_464710 [Hypoxylon sp. FL1150]
MTTPFEPTSASAVVTSLAAVAMNVNTTDNYTDYNYVPTDKLMRTTISELPTAMLLFTSLCLIPALTMIIAHFWRGRETSAQEVLMSGIRMFALGFGYMVVGAISLPVLVLHHPDGTQTGDVSDLDLDDPKDDPEKGSGSK